MKEVAVGIIFRNGTVLTGQRKPTARYPLKWEFPGGKLEPGETPAAALVRELHEELGIDASPGPEFHRQEWDYGDRAWRVYYFRVHAFTGEPENRTFARIRWVTPEELLAMDILDGNREVVEMLCRNVSGPQDADSAPQGQTARDRAADGGNDPVGGDRQ